MLLDTARDDLPPHGISSGVPLRCSRDVSFRDSTAVVDEILQLIETRQPSAIRMIVDLRRNPESSARPTAALRSENMFIDEFLDSGAVSVLAVNLTSVICPHRNSLTIKGIL